MAFGLSPIRFLGRQSEAPLFSAGPRRQCSLRQIENALSPGRPNREIRSCYSCYFFLRTLASAIPSSLSYGHRMRLLRLGHKRQKMRTLEGLYCSSFHNSFGFCNFTHINYKSLVIYTAINRAKLPRAAVKLCRRPRLAKCVGERGTAD
jgi:hypothetical protein